MFLKKKRNCHEIIYDSSIGIKETFWCSSVDMKTAL